LISDFVYTIKWKETNKNRQNKQRKNKQSKKQNKATKKKKQTNKNKNKNKAKESIIYHSANAFSISSRKIVAT
jgi:hypothetical protein